MNLREFVEKKDNRFTFVRIVDENRKYLGAVDSHLNDYIITYGNCEITGWAISDRTTVTVSINTNQ